MAYTGEVLQRARARLAQAKADREAEYAHNLMQAYAQVPRLAEIDRTLRRTMAKTARLVFQEGSDAKEAFAQVRKENQALQWERETLIAENFEADFLDDTPICTTCGGDGYVGAQMCDCLRELCRQEQKKELTLLSGMGQESFAAFRLDYYPDQIDPSLGASPRTIMSMTLSACKRYAQSFSRKSGSLLLNGNPGLGKTFLSACIARTVADNGYSVIYESAVHLFNKMEEARFGSPADAEQAKQDARRYDKCDLLIIDDLGTEMTTQFTVSALYTLINDRLMEGLPTVVSTNLNGEQLAARYNPQIASRLLGSYRLVAFVGNDIRLQKARG